MEENIGYGIYNKNTLQVQSYLLQMQFILYRQREKRKCHLTEFTRFNIEVPETTDSNRNGSLEVLNMQSGE